MDSKPLTLKTHHDHLNHHLHHHSRHHHFLQSNGMNKMEKGKKVEKKETEKIV